ncbi:hypothetical protein Mal35_26430 [Gimesia maris]|nr:hypothetical protein Mal35_26430 [Gimesia maris]
MLSNKNKDSMPVRKSRFSICGISMATDESNRFTVSIGFPGSLLNLESSMTGDQLVCFREFQKVVLIDHGLLLYNEEIDQARGSHKRCQIWRSILTSHTSELM